MLTHREPRALSIALVVDRFGSRYGGAEAYGVALMHELARRGHQVTVFARAYDDACEVRLPFRQVSVWHRWPGWLRGWLFARRAARHTRQGGFDIVHSHMNGWCGDVEVVHVTPVRYRWGVQPMPRWKRWLAVASVRVQAYRALESRRLASRPAHRVVAVSRLIAHQLVQAYGPRLETVEIIPPGVQPAEAVTPAVREAARQALGVPQGSFLCLLVARNPLRKGLPTVLRALESLPEAVRLVVVGADGPARDAVRRAPAPLRARVTLVPETAQVAPYYQSADLYVHPTLNDSFGMAPLEAMSFGLPVVLSPPPWCGFAQYVQAGVEALVLDHPENAEALAAAIRSVREEDALRAQLRTGAGAVVRRHAWPEVARRYLALYQAILDERAAAGRSD